MKSTTEVRTYRTLRDCNKLRHFELVIEKSMQRMFSHCDEMGLAPETAMDEVRAATLEASHMASREAREQVLRQKVTEVGLTLDAKVSQWPSGSELVPFISKEFRVTDGKSQVLAENLELLELEDWLCTYMGERK